MQEGRKTKNQPLWQSFFVVIFTQMANVSLHFLLYTKASNIGSKVCVSPQQQRVSEWNKTKRSYPTQLAYTTALSKRFLKRACEKRCCCSSLQYDTPAGFHQESQLLPIEHAGASHDTLSQVRKQISYSAHLAMLPTGVYMRRLFSAHTCGMHVCWDDSGWNSTRSQVHPGTTPSTNYCNLPSTSSFAKTRARVYLR